MAYAKDLLKSRGCMIITCILIGSPIFGICWGARQGKRKERKERKETPRVKHFMAHFLLCTLHRPSPRH